MPQAPAADLLAILQKHWGYDAFRPLQEEVITASLGGRDCMLVLPTGGGKSLCYQLPAAASDGCVLVVSPLIALMDDQVGAAREMGLNAVAIHSNLAGEERMRAMMALDDADLDLIYVSPERLCVGDLLGRLRNRLRLVAIDEAHCISHWGHDFRPEYRQLASVLDQVPQVPRMGLTATATPQVQDDICRMLGLRDPLRLVGHIDRPNLRYRCWPRRKAVDQILRLVKEHPGEGGIVYAQTRKKTEELAEKLRKQGLNAACYHAGMPADERAFVQKEFVSERIDLVVATVAFGMGIDRSNVRFVVHHNMPRSIEHYQQESGRAGRDGETADCVLLSSAGDLMTHRFLANKDGPMDADRSRALEDQLRAIGRFAVAPVCRHEMLCRHFGQDYAPTKGDGCGACDVCLGETDVMPEADAETTARKILSAVWRCRNRFGLAHVVEVLRGASTEKVRRAGHHEMPTHGILKDHDEGTVRTWIDQLIVQGHLMVNDNDGYPLLQLTESGAALCKSGGAVRLGQPVKGTSKRSRSAQRDETAWEGVDRDCYEQLRGLRKLLAEAIGKPPYVVFTDKTLRELATIKPDNRDELLLVKGIGEQKADRFGHAVLDCLRSGDPERAMGLFDLDPA